MTRRTGPTEETRALVVARARYRCEVCGIALDLGWSGFSVHHRTPRGMGGSRDPRLNLPSNLLALCGSGTTGCHGRVERDRAVAVDNGWIVPRWADPAEFPVLVFGDRWVILTEHGTCEAVTETSLQTASNRG